MRLGIDASNLRSGGGITHLLNLLREAEPQVHGFSQVVVWGGMSFLNQVEDRPWLIKSRQIILDKGSLFRLFWRRFSLSRLAREACCDVLFVPGGSFAGDFHPIVTMSRNMLPFEWNELRRFGFSLTSLRLLLLRLFQARTYRKADGLIFLTQYAHDVVMTVGNLTSGKETIIPHGVDTRFILPPREQLAIEQYSDEKPFRIIYVSIVDMYKHQWNVAEAVAMLRNVGLPVSLELIGPGYPPALARLEKVLDRVDRKRKFVRVEGHVPNHKLVERYSRADLCLFASSCENMPNILLEGMASGLPIACSNRGPMPEVLGEAGVYFDPEVPEDIQRALRLLIDSPRLRARLADGSFSRVHNYSWKRCASDTFAYLAKITQSSREN